MKSDLQYVQELQTLLSLVAENMNQLKLRGVAVQFSINTSTDPVSVVGFGAVKSILPVEAPQQAVVDQDNAQGPTLT